jgi:chromate transporter
MDDVPATVPPYAELAMTFLWIGTTSFGGMWAATRQLQDELVFKKRWIDVSHQQSLMVAATLIPAPKFLAFGGLVGYHLRGWRGSVIAMLALMIPGSLFVLLGAALLNPAAIGAPLAPVLRAISIAVVGLLLGNACHQVKAARTSRRKRTIGVALTAAVAGAAMAGVPLLLAALAGFAIGPLLLRVGEGDAP